MDSLWAEIQSQLEAEIKIIVQDCRKILNQAIIDTVYSYNPRSYDRTNQLNDIANIDYKMEEDGGVTIFINTTNMEYYSFGKGEGHDNSGLSRVPADVVVHVLEVGHDTYSPHDSGNDMFRHYTARHFLEEACSRMKDKYPELDFEVIREQPNIFS